MADEQQSGYGVIRDLIEARIAAMNAQREDLRGYYPAACVVLLREVVRLEQAARAAPPPEPRNISDAWNRVRAEARALARGNMGIAAMLAAVETYGDARAAESSSSNAGVQQPDGGQR